MPDRVVMFNAQLLTWIADITKRPPLLGISTDQVKLMKSGSPVDGSKAERELGVTYTPIRVAVEEAVVSFRE